MMVVSQIPIDIIAVLQAFILAFVAAPAIIRAIYRIRTPKEAEEGVVTVRTWGGN
jgi:simple sugar transport system permease protein